MSENKNNICPCCHKACDLNAPRCSRGEEYLRTGVIPQKGRGCHHHEENPHPNYEEMGIEEKLFVLLGKLGRMGYGAFDGKSSQNRILHILSKAERMTQRELTEQLGIRPGSASEIIKKLETAGLIVRQSNSEDRRTVDIALTDAGKAQVEENDSQFGHTNHALFESLSDEEKQQLLALLEKLGQDWHNRFRGEGRSEHKHHGKDDREHACSHGHKHGRDHEHRRGERHGHDSEHGHDHRQGHGHHHDSF